ncbi:hypothetical protein KUTeg_016237, partial [Tegillarca granosa]
MPDSPEQIQTDFLLYTRLNPATEQHLSYDDSVTLNTSNFDSSKMTRFIIHGFTHNGHRQWLANLVAALLKKEDSNVIVVDWGHGAGIPYGQATANTRVVGAEIAVLIQSMISQGASASNMHLIGHSLGAHIAGYAGERVAHIGRITGLDPADPYFQGTDTRVRLDPSDADFVDVIHTDGSSITSLGMGAIQAMGHVDFYPNGGKDQPGCDAGAVNKLTDTVWTAVTHLDYYAAEGAVACSHERSYAYFTESVNSECPFRAYPCTSADEFHSGNCLRCHGDDCSEMGFNADKFKTAQGSHYLETQGSAPYCDYHFQINITGNNNMGGKLLLAVQGTKGHSGEIKLMTDNEHHTTGHSISKFFKLTKDIGDVTSIALQYEKESGLLAGFIYPDNFELLGVQ